VGRSAHPLFANPQQILPLAKFSAAFGESGFSGRTVSPWQFKACTFGRKSLALRMLFIPRMKRKQIPDDFRDWIEARTFEIGAAIVLPPGCPGLFQANPYSAIRRRPSHWRKSPLKPMQYEALYEALEAAHEILPRAKVCDAKDSELRKKIRKLEKAVRKRQEKSRPSWRQEE
jgi:hypothetical protein